MKRKVLLFHAVMILLIHGALRVQSVRAETFDCLIKPYMVVNISSVVEGVLDAVTVDRGDRVKQGQVLARLESSVERATVARFRARAAMEEAIKINQARLELNTRRYSRNHGLYQKALIAADEMDEVETTKRLSELDLREAMEKQRLAQLDLQRALAELNRRTIKSPITGVVVDRLRHPGEFADEHPILTLAQMHPLRVDVFVPVRLLGQIAVGMTAEVMPEPPVGGVHEARVTAVDRVVDAASGMFSVRLELPNRDYRMPAGLKCQVRFQLLPRHERQVSASQTVLPPASRPASPSRRVPAAGSQRVSSSASRPEPPQAQTPASPMQPASPSSLTSLEGKIKPGETASELFVRAGIQTAQVMALRHAIRPVYDIRRLRVGQPYRIQLTPDQQLQRFTYEIDGQHRLEVERQQETFKGRVVPISYQRYERLVSARIVGSVYATLLEQGESPRLVRDVADIFAPKVNFLSGIQPQNALCLLIEEHSRPNRKPRYQRILAAILENGGQSWQAVYYEHNQTKGYYQSDGQALQGPPLPQPDFPTFLAQRQRLLAKLAPCRSGNPRPVTDLQARLDLPATE